MPREIGQAINAGYPWLEIRCSRCKAPRSVELAAPHAATICVHDLAARLRCVKCGKASKRPPSCCTWRPAKELVITGLTRRRDTGFAGEKWNISYDGGVRVGSIGQRVGVPNHSTSGNGSAASIESAISRNGTSASNHMGARRATAFSTAIVANAMCLRRVV
ncbi:hypothetical protein JQ633_33550 [Bradyrhizobium tropiciagri]|uniref:hypothetical protein n=1 Tax=Bradyrhizobium tropiciagri TaxID=312253 RepID=UPI001BA60B8B|nr:hypothetical protein [Bradyrhizobium tropiciagri]MBR0875324.1 hypothetical protein [Bradyrhizobium tropiciagri]